MFVTETLDKATKPLFSYEIIPPKRGKSAREILQIVEQLVPYDPPFLDVTSHSAEALYDENPDGSIRRRVRRKRTGTISICGIIQNRYNIDTVPHLLCRGFTKEETEDAMIELGYLGIHNVLAIRGDESNFKKPVGTGRSVNLHASNLVSQLNDLKNGKYLEEIANSDPIEMCIGVGGYPEKHFEAPTRKRDIQRIKAKVDAGADYIVTQMFFDNSHFYSFVDDCRAAGITVPIIPGLKIVSKDKQLSRLAKNFHINFPDELEEEIHTNPSHGHEIGVKWAIAQAADLLNNGVKCIHFYIMEDTEDAIEVVRAL
jgi:methylenetetrahydrofolate reductase (NADH)